MYEKRLRMLAGPNGSGKSTIYRSIKGKYDIGTWVNADDIEKELKQQGCINPLDYNIDTISSDYFEIYIKNHSLYSKLTKDGFKIDLKISRGKIISPNSNTHSYEASILADFIRTQLIDNGKKLTFETVMSHESKIHTLKRA